MTTSIFPWVIALHSMIADAQTALGTTYPVYECFSVDTISNPAGGIIIALDDWNGGFYTKTGSVSITLYQPANPALTISDNINAHTNRLYALANQLATQPVKDGYLVWAKFSMGAVQIEGPMADDTQGDNVFGPITVHWGLAE